MRESEATRPAACLFCASPQITAVGSVPNGALRGSTVEVFRCDLCRSQSASPTSTERNSELYNSVYSTDADGGYARYKSFALLEQPSMMLELEFVYAAAWRAINSVNPKRVVEVGSGLGYLTAALRDLGIEAYGVDLSKSAVQQASERYGPWFRTTDGSSLSVLLNDLGKIDLIVSLEVIEHTRDPAEFVRDIVDLATKHQAPVLLTTPNRDFSSGGAIWHTDLPPIHLHWISRTGLACLLGRIGLRSTEFVADPSHVTGQNLLLSKAREFSSEPWQRVRYSSDAGADTPKRVSWLRGLSRFGHNKSVVKLSNSFMSKFLREPKHLVFLCEIDPNV